MTDRSHPSPGFDHRPIGVELLVLHSTGGALVTALALLTDPGREASSHLVIAEDGEVLELVRCWDGDARRARHAGESRWQEGERV